MHAAHNTSSWSCYSWYFMICISLPVSYKFLFFYFFFSITRVSVWLEYEIAINKEQVVYSTSHTYFSTFFFIFYNNSHNLHTTCLTTYLLTAVCHKHHTSSSMLVAYNIWVIKHLCFTYICNLFKQQTICCHVWLSYTLSLYVYWMCNVGTWHVMYFRNNIIFLFFC